MQSAEEFAADYLARLGRALVAVPPERLARIVAVLEEAHAARRQVFIIGNGGSASTASHMMNDLCKTTLGPRADTPGPRFRAIALTDNVPMMTAWSNDFDFDRIFAEPLRALAEPGDVLIAISASGNSPNIVAAVEAARECGLTVIGLAGFGGGRLAALADVALVVASDEYGPVEDVHLAVNHIIAMYLAEKLAAHAPGRTV